MLTTDTKAFTYLC